MNPTQGPLSPFVAGLAGGLDHEDIVWQSAFHGQTWLACIQSILYNKVFSQIVKYHTTSQIKENKQTSSPHFKTSPCLSFNRLYKLMNWITPCFLTWSASSLVSGQLRGLPSVSRPILTTESQETQIIYGLNYSHTNKTSTFPYQY